MRSSASSAGIGPDVIDVPYQALEDALVHRLMVQGAEADRRVA